MTWKCKYCGYYKNSDQFYTCANCHRERDVPKQAAEPKKGGGPKIDDSTEQGLIRIGVGLLSFVVFFFVSLQAFISSMPNLWVVPAAIFVIAWIVIMFYGKISSMVGILAVFLLLSFFISYTGLNVESYILASPAGEFLHSAGCWFQAIIYGALGPMQQYFQKEYTGGTNVVELAYKSCMGVGEEQKVNWGCGADCLKVSVEGTPINGKPLLLRIMLAADKSLQQDLENVKVEVYDSKGTAFETTACTKEKPCTVPKADTVEFFANIETVSCRGSAYDFKIKTSYDYSAYTPKFDVTVYQSRNEAEKKTEIKSETGYGPLKLLFAGSGKYYADELQYAGGAIPVQIRMYYVPGGGTSMKNEKVVGQKVTIDVFPYTGVPECDEAATEEGGKIILTGKFEVGDKFSYNFYPYAFCKFKAPELEGPYKTVGFVGHADYTFEFEKSMVAICAG